MKKIKNKKDYLQDIAKFSKLKFSKDEKKTAELYPFLATNYYLGLIGRDFRKDPIFRQCFPDGRELIRDSRLTEDPLAEEKQMPVPRLIHRYADRAVLLVTNRCAVHCRFCFRKRKWRSGNEMRDITEKELHDACKYIRKNPKIREILVSGGDPLVLDIKSLENIIGKLSRIGSIDAIRIGTRMPVVLPSRIDQRLVKMLSKFLNLWIMTHFNHPVELTPEATAACRRLSGTGIPILNQTVLLKGINDRADILEELFRTLARIRVKPHYLFHVDPAEGNMHFRTGIPRALKLLKELRPRLSSLCTPAFAIDLPEGGGKVLLVPEYRRGKGYEGINGRTIRYP